MQDTQIIHLYSVEVLSTPDDSFTPLYAGPIQDPATSFQNSKSKAIILISAMSAAIFCIICCMIIYYTKCTCKSIMTKIRNCKCICRNKVHVDKDIENTQQTSRKLNE